MSAVNALETAILQLLFNNTNLANIGDATGLRGSSTTGSFYISLHTADPGETGSNASEATYTGYARVAVVRSASGFTVSGDTVINAAAVEFTICTAGTNAITHFAIQTASTGDTMIFKGALTSALNVSANVRPKFEAGTLQATAA